MSGLLAVVQLEGSVVPPGPNCESQTNSFGLPFASVSGQVQSVAKAEQKGLLTGVAPTSHL